MDIGDQSAVIAFLKDPASYGEAGPVEVIETHISLVFLIGERAFKLKRAVTYPYIDSSTVALRLALCEKEVTLNRRTAPDLYLGVRRVMRGADGSLRLDGQGETVDALVEMRRFDQNNLFDRLAMADRLTPRLMEQTALTIARFHDKAEVIHRGGGVANMAGVLDINEAGFATSHVFEPDEVAALNANFRSALAARQGALDRREAAGKVRLCHGDLHLRNIFLFDGVPLLFDCIDFNDDIATVDVLYDLAFLLMDLWHRGHSADANLVMNRYLDRTGDEAGFALLPFLMAVRAQVRAHVTATQAEGAADRRADLKASARSYFDLAALLLAPSPARIVAIGGLSGSGKSSVADALAPRFGPPPGARILESDRIRKALFGVPPDHRLPGEAYAPDVSEKVYGALDGNARSILAAGGCVVVNAVFDRATERERIEAVARALAVPFTGIWLDADAQTLRRRVCGRKGGSSDATVDILERQLAKESGETGWRRIDAAPPLDTVVAQVAAAL